jgi:hypothetical protein
MLSVHPSKVPVINCVTECHMHVMCADRSLPLIPTDITTMPLLATFDQLYNYKRGFVVENCKYHIIIFHIIG